jgi:P-type Mg2+ transporter
MLPMIVTVNLAKGTLAMPRQRVIGKRLVESLLSQTLIIHIIGTRRVAFIESRASLPLTVMSVVVCLIGIALPYSALAPGLQLMPLPTTYWPILLAMIMAYLALTHLMKIWLHRRFRVD